MSRRISDVVAAEIVAARGEGLSLRQVAERFGVSPPTVARKVHDAGMCDCGSDAVGVTSFVLKRAGVVGIAERVQIAVGIERDESNAVIGARIGFDRSTVWREIKRNGGRDGYDPQRAHERALAKAKRARPCWIDTRPWLWARVVELLLTKKWSPEQISARLALDHDLDPDWCVSHESIYRAIFVQAKPELRKELAACLRSGRARRVSRGRRSGGSGGSIPNMVNISQRPAEVEDRAVPGHWEGDLILGKNGKSAVATLVERSTRFAILVKLENKTAGHVADQISAAIKTLPAALARTLTWDQGTELADHHRISFESNVEVYFCDPHSPWQRGSNENTNGLIRQFLPKGTDLSVHSQQDLDEIADLLNTRPRKTLGWDTPAERINALVAATA